MSNVSEAPRYSVNYELGILGVIGDLMRCPETKSK